MDCDAYYDWHESTNESAHNNNNDKLDHRGVANSSTGYDCQSADSDKGVYLVEPVDAKQNSNGSRVLTRQNERTGSNRVESHIYDELEYDLSHSTQEYTPRTSRIGSKENLSDYLKKNKILIGAAIGIILIVTIVVGIVVAIQGNDFFFNSSMKHWDDRSALNID